MTATKVKELPLLKAKEVKIVIRIFIPKSKYAKNVLTLMTGTGLAQAIPIAITPILTRIYSPEDFGIFALYVAIVAVLTIVVTGRYELAIMLPKKDEEAVNVLGLSVFLSFTLSLFLLFLIFFFGTEIAILLNSPEISPWLYWIPISTLFAGVYQSLNYWSNRQQNYSRLAVSRIFQSVGLSGGQLGLGVKSASPGGLITGQVFGVIISTIVLAVLIKKDDHQLISRINKKDILVQAKRFKNFPKFLVFAHGFNTASAQAVVVLLSSLFNGTVAGLYMLTQRVLGAPVSLVANALADVFRQEASYSYAHYGECINIYKKTFKKLLLIASPLFLAFYFIAPELFAIAFGEGWREAGEYAQILTPMFFLRFVTSPLSSMFMIAEQQVLDLIWQIILFISTSSSLVVGYFFGDVTLALYLYMASYVVLFTLNCVMTYLMAKGVFKKQNK